MSQYPDAWRSFLTRSLETYTAYMAVAGIVLAALLTFVPALAFGSFWRMASVFVGADVLRYLAIKAGLLALPRPLRK